MEKKTRKKSKILPILLVLVIVIILLIICITSSVTKKQKEKKQEQINQSEQEAIDKFNQPINEITEKQNTILNNSNTMTYQGFEMIGNIEISSINLKYPILNDSTPKALRESVCLIYGSINNGKNAVIIGNDKMFKNLKNVSTNDEISITDTKSTKTQYIVYGKFQISSTDTSFWDRDTQGKNEITLSTVADNGTDRLIILAKEK